MLLPQNSYRYNGPLLGSLDIRTPSLDYLSVNMHIPFPTVPWQPTTLTFAAVTLLQLRDAPHTALSHLHVGMVERLPNLRHTEFHQCAPQMSDYFFGTGSATEDSIVLAIGNFLASYAVYLRVLQLLLALYYPTHLIPILRTACSCSELRVLYFGQRPRKYAAAGY